MRRCCAWPCNPSREQTFREWEAVIVNNFSEDDTVEVVPSFDDPRMRLINFRNHGIIGAWE